MVGETVTETWFGNLWKSSRKSISWEPERPVLGIMAFEISSWHSEACFGDDDYLMDLALAEIIENLGSVFKSVVVLGKKCTEPVYHNLERVFDDASEIDRKWHGWRYKLKKMEKNVKKMERFVAVTEQLYQELDVLAELEQSLRGMRAGGDSGQVKLLEFQQKVVWQRQQVKNFREMSPWIRTYEYAIRLLLRSIFTIVERIKFVCGTKQSVIVEGRNSYGHVTNDCLIRSSSISAFIQTSVYPSETNQSKFAVNLGGRFQIWASEDAALAYANLIILIEKLASSPHLISSDARDDLYAMLPASIRSSLRAKLKTFPRTLASSVYDAAFAAEWSSAVARILEWVSPLAHNMVRWQSERNFERQRLISGSNVLLVQTLYFANQVETEAAIVELLMGLNYLSRFGREFNQKPFQESSSSRAGDGYVFSRDNMYYKMIDQMS
ncbi:hypothetical protein Sango_1988500 [Sesamum angolense]|uniref:DUF668 domain-containing protein n=1 Tax=Sesamum angolense TaxID=2727404 RepID=A0AAE1WEY1_9LAMI|nr:hypothetical protein Sango_1988500 [Sesamum angolense]